MRQGSRLVRGVELDGRHVADVRITCGRISEVGAGLRRAPGEPVTEGRGAALVPGLHDHHIHLLATAAADLSVPCGAPEVTSRDALRRALAQATPRAGWIRGVGYDDGAVGLLDRADLDAMRADVPVRLQHRGGSLWVLNGAAMRRLGLDDRDHGSVERDAAGRATGRVWRGDDLVRGDDLLRGGGPAPDRAAPDLGALGRRLAAYGVTGVTDATPDLSPETVRLLRTAGLPQRLTLLGDPAGAAPWKVVVPDHALPAPDELAATIAAVRPRPVALHCVSRVGLVVAVTALRAVGPVPGDRVEHAAVGPPELAAALAALGVTVVTQPTLVARRGDDYLDQAEPDDRPYLWPYASLLAAGVRIGGSSDAPYGDPDPWRSVTAARDRHTPSGRTVVAGERVDAGRALAGFLTPPDDPGGEPRRVRAGVPADLVLLDRPLAAALAVPSAEHVRLTLVGGVVLHGS